MGLVVFTLVLGAVAGLAVAVGDGWQATEGAQALETASRQAAAQLERTLRAARYVGAASAGRVAFWVGDANADGKMQLSEIGLIEHDAAASRLVLYTVAGTSSMAALVCTAGDIGSTQDAATFKAIPGCTGRAMAANVSAASFALYNAGSTTQSPVVEFVLTFARGGQAWTRYGAATLRAEGVAP